MSRGVALAWFTVRQVLARRRWIVVALLAVLPVVVAALMRLYGGDLDGPGSAADVVTALSYTIVIPLIALILANAGFGAEVDDGTVAFLLTKPVGRVTIVIVKVLVIATVAKIAAVMSTILTSVILIGGVGPQHLIWALGIGAGVGAVLYAVVFVTLGLLTRRGLLIGLVYLIVWEGTFAALFPGTRSISIRQYMLSIADAVTGSQHLFTAHLEHSTAVIMSVVVFAAAVAFAIARLRGFEAGRVG